MWREKGRNKETVRMRHGEGEGEHDRITGDSEQEVPDQGQLDQIGTQSSGHPLEQISQSDQPNTASSGHWTHNRLAQGTPDSWTHCLTRGGGGRGGGGTFQGYFWDTQGQGHSLTSSNTTRHDNYAIATFTPVVVTRSV